MPRNQSERVPKAIAHYIEMCNAYPKCGCKKRYDAWTRLPQSFREEVEKHRKDFSKTYDDYALYAAEKYGLDYAPKQF